MKAEQTFEQHIDRLERWVAGDEDRVARDLLTKRGITVLPASSLSDSRLRKSLRTLIDALAAEKIYLENTNHLSDRQLHERIETEVLPNSFAVGGDDWDVWDFAAVYDAETREVYLAYYADEEERTMWSLDVEEGPVPPRRLLPYDRDRKLPQPPDED